MKGEGKGRGRGGGEGEEGGEGLMPYSFHIQVRTSIASRNSR